MNKLDNHRKDNRRLKLLLYFQLFLFIKIFAGILLLIFGAIFSHKSMIIFGAGIIMSGLFVTFLNADGIKEETTGNYMGKGWW